MEKKMEMEMEMEWKKIEEFINEMFKDIREQANIHPKVKEYFKADLKDKIYEDLLQTGMTAIKNDPNCIKEIFHDLKQTRLIETYSLMEYIEPENLECD